jgi:hypothetical protein
MRIQVLSLYFFLFFKLLSSVYCTADSNDVFFISEHFTESIPKVIAVLPMDNMAYDKTEQDVLRQAVYERLQFMGYQKVEAEKVDEVMDEFGIQTPKMIEGIDFGKLSERLNCDAFIMGQIEQSAHIASPAFSANVVTCSLWMIDCKSKRVIWSQEKRASHRQLIADPINLFINLHKHATSDRKVKIKWLVQEMMKTLLKGPVVVVPSDLLNKAKPVKADEE